MPVEALIDAWWDDAVKVWIPTSSDVPGLVVEAENWGVLLNEVRLVIDDLLEVNEERERPSVLVFKAEQRLAWPAA